jgi:tetratricopeptide (TPR) repeat protein
MDASAVLEAFLRALGTPPGQIPTEIDSRAALFRTVTAGRRLLIIADNARDSDHVRPLLPGPGNVLITTSRDQLRALTARDGAHRVAVNPLTASDATDLLTRILGWDRVASQLDDVAALGGLCARLPLALTIAAEYAARHPALPLSELTKQLKYEQSVLDTVRTGDGDVRTDLRAVFSWSYQALDPDSASMFRLLGLHPGTSPISVLAAAALAGIPAGAAQRLLDQLAAAHLLEHLPPDRYDFHDLLRSYANEKAHQEDKPADRDNAVRRALDWHLYTAAHAAPWFAVYKDSPIELPDPDPRISPRNFTARQSALDWMEAHRATLLAAFTETIESGRDVSARRFTGAIHWFLHGRYYWHDLAYLVHIALPVARRVDDPQWEAELLIDLGIAQAALGQYDMATAATHFERTLRLCQAIDYRLGQVRCLNDLGYIAEMSEHYAEALDYGRQARRICHDRDDPVGEARTLNSMAMSYVGLRQYQQAVSCCQEALALLASAADNKDLAHSLHTPHILDSLGQAYAGLGRRQDAIDTYERALRHATQIANHRIAAFIRFNLGRALRDSNDHDGARANWEQALNTLTLMCDPFADDVRAEFATLNPAVVGS